MKMDPKFEANFPADTRFETVSQILTQAREGNFAQVVGIPGTGRSNLVGLLAYNKKLRLKHLGEEDEKIFHFIPLNFSEIRGKNTADALKFLYLGILDSLHEREMHDLGEELERSYPRDETEELRIAQVLKRAVDFLTLEKDLKLVLLFDHFEEYIPSVQEGFFAHLASLQLRERYHFAVVFFLHRPLEQLVTAESMTDVLKLLSGRTIFLPVNDPPLIEFLISYIQNSLNKSLSEELRNRIIDITGGHAKLIKVVTEEMFSEGILNQVQDDRHAFDELIRENRAIRSVLYEIWGVFYPEEQTVLRKLSTGENVAEEMRAILGYLSHIDVVKDGKFTIPLFHEFVKYRAEHHLDEKIHYDPSRNRLFKGEVDLTERLTASEFALLRYLLEHPDAVVTRDELVNVVWGEMKSTAGVTEQALDQLLFRLRQKIEDNPTEPRHLNTIKGRGIKFTP